MHQIFWQRGDCPEYGCIGENEIVIEDTDSVDIVDAQSDDDLSDKETSSNDIDVRLFCTFLIQ